VAIGETYAVKVYQSWQGVEFGMNTFAYRQQSGSITNAAEDILDEFKADVWAAVRSCMIPASTTYRIQVINIARPVDSIDSPEDLDGTLTASGGLLAPFYCLAVRRPAAFPGQKFSYHHFAMQSAGQLFNNAPGWSADYQDTIVAMIDNLGSLVESASGAYEPVQIAGNWTYGVAPTVRRVLLGQWQFNVGPTTVNSRKDAYYQWKIVP